MRPAPDFSTPTHPAASGAASIATTTVFYSARDGKPAMNVVVTDATGRVVTSETQRVPDKIAAMTYAKSIGARFTA